MRSIDLQFVGGKLRTVIGRAGEAKRNATMTISYNPADRKGMCCSLSEVKTLKDSASGRQCWWETEFAVLGKVI